MSDRRQWVTGGSGNYDSHTTLCLTGRTLGTLSETSHGWVTSHLWHFHVNGVLAKCPLLTCAHCGIWLKNTAQKLQGIGENNGSSLCDIFLIVFVWLILKSRCYNCGFDFNDTLWTSLKTCRLFRAFNMRGCFFILLPSLWFWASTQSKSLK